MVRSQRKSAPVCRVFYLFILLLLSQTIWAQGPQNKKDLSWMIGEWSGRRVDQADGSRGDMNLEVRSILDGAGLLSEMEIAHDGGVYRGIWIQVFNPKTETWKGQYANAVRGTWVALEGDGMVFLSHNDDGTVRSKLENRRLENGQWRRIQSRTNNGGNTWTVIFIDTLNRVEK